MISKHNRYWLKKRNKVMDLLGGKCAHCGHSDRRVLHIDHIVPLLRKSSGRKIKDNASQVLQDFDNKVMINEVYQLLCANCHWIKTYHTEKEHLRRASESMPDRDQHDLFATGPN